MKISLFLSAFLVVSSLIADQHSDENRLLKSWGFKFNTQGQLVFKSENKKHLEYQPWSPDLAGYQLDEPERKSPEILHPLVISAKNKSEN